MLEKYLNPEAWFMCKYCKRCIQGAINFVQHKREAHAQLYWEDRKRKEQAENRHDETNNALAPQVDEPGVHTTRNEREMGSDGEISDRTPISETTSIDNEHNEEGGIVERNIPTERPNNLAQRVETISKRVLEILEPGVKHEDGDEPEILCVGVVFKDLQYIVTPDTPQFPITNKSQPEPPPAPKENIPSYTSSISNAEMGKTINPTIRYEVTAQIHSRLRELQQILKNRNPRGSSLQESDEEDDSESTIIEPPSTAELFQPISPPSKKIPSTAVISTVPNGQDSAISDASYQKRPGQITQISKPHTTREILQPAAATTHPQVNKITHESPTMLPTVHRSTNQDSYSPILEHQHNPQDTTTLNDSDIPPPKVPHLYVPKAGTSLVQETHVAERGTPAKSQLVSWTKHLTHSAPSQPPQFSSRLPEPTAPSPHHTSTLILSEHPRPERTCHSIPPSLPPSETNVPKLKTPTSGPTRPKPAPPPIISSPRICYKAPSNKPRFTLTSAPKSINQIVPIQSTRTVFNSPTTPSSAPRLSPPQRPCHAPPVSLPRLQPAVPGSSTKSLPGPPSPLTVLPPEPPSTPAVLTQPASQIVTLKHRNQTSDLHPVDSQDSTSVIIEQSDTLDITEIERLMAAIHHESVPDSDPVINEAQNDAKSNSSSTSLQEPAITHQVNETLLPQSESIVYIIQENSAQNTVQVLHVQGGGGGEGAESTMYVLNIAEFNTMQQRESSNDIQSEVTGTQLLPNSDNSEKAHRFPMLAEMLQNPVSESQTSSAHASLEPPSTATTATPLKSQPSDSSASAVGQGPSSASSEQPKDGAPSSSTKEPLGSSFFDAVHSQSTLALPGGTTAETCQLEAVCQLQSVTSKEIAVTDKTSVQLNKPRLNKRLTRQRRVDEEGAATIAPSASSLKDPIDNQQIKKPRLIPNEQRPKVIGQNFQAGSTTCTWPYRKKAAAFRHKTMSDEESEGSFPVPVITSVFQLQRSEPEIVENPTDSPALQPLTNLLKPKTVSSGSRPGRKRSNPVSIRLQEGQEISPKTRKGNKIRNMDFDNLKASDLSKIPQVKITLVPCDNLVLELKKKTIINDQAKPVARRRGRPRLNKAPPTIPATSKTRKATNQRCLRSSKQSTVSRRDSVGRWAKSRTSNTSYKTSSPSVQGSKESTHFLRKSYNSYKKSSMCNQKSPVILRNKSVRKRAYRRKSSNFDASSLLVNVSEISFPFEPPPDPPNTLLTSTAVNPPVLIPESVKVQVTQRSYNDQGFVRRSVRFRRRNVTLESLGSAPSGKVHKSVQLKQPAKSTTSANPSKIPNSSKSPAKDTSDPQVRKSSTGDANSPPLQKRGRGRPKSQPPVDFDSLPPEGAIIRIRTSRFGRLNPIKSRESSRPTMSKLRRISVSKPDCNKKSSKENLIGATTVISQSSQPAPLLQPESSPVLPQVPSVFADPVPPKATLTHLSQNSRVAATGREISSKNWVSPTGFCKRNYRPAHKKSAQIFICRFCDKLFSNSLLYRRHERVAHPPSPKPKSTEKSNNVADNTPQDILFCLTCGEIFSQRELLFLHEESHGYGSKKCYCGQCKVTTWTDSSNSLRDHNYHFNAPKENGLCQSHICAKCLRGTEPCSETQKETVYYHCSFCPLILPSSRQRCRHEKQDHPNGFYNQSNIEKEPSIFLCSVCGISFSSEVILKLHESMHEV